MGVIVFSISGKLLYDDAKALLDNQAKQMVNVFDQYIGILKNAVMSTERQKNVQSLIDGNSSGYESYLVYRDAYDYLKNINTFFEGIHVYVVVTDKQYIMSSNPQDVVGNYKARSIDRQPWFQGLEESLGGTMLVPDFVTLSSGKQGFAYAMRVRDIYRWRSRAGWTGRTFFLPCRITASASRRTCWQGCGPIFLMKQVRFGVRVSESGCEIFRSGCGCFTGTDTGFPWTVVLENLHGSRFGFLRRGKGRMGMQEKQSNGEERGRNRDGCADCFDCGR